MGRINFSVKDKVELKFREEVFKRKGMKKGNLKESLEEAMLMWIGNSSEHESDVHKR